MEHKKFQKWKKFNVKPKKPKIEHSNDYFLIQSVHMDVLIKKRNVASKLLDNINETCEIAENVENINKIPSN